MKLEKLPIEGLMLLHSPKHCDDRGFFVERFQKKLFDQDFVLDAQSRSKPGVLRGLHYQIKNPQAKLISVLRGKILDVVVDLRPDSSSFGRHFSIELSDQEDKSLFVPQGFAHGFCVLGDEEADVLYKMTRYHEPGTGNESGLHWADPDLKISWPNKRPILSAKDAALPSWKDFLAQVKT